MRKHWVLVTLVLFTVSLTCYAIALPHTAWLVYTGLIRSDVPNVIQVLSGIAAVWAIRKFNCSQRGCLRLGFHRVDGTTYRTCRHHLTAEHHAALKERHAERHPEAHKVLNG